MAPWPPKSTGQEKILSLNGPQGPPKGDLWSPVTVGSPPEDGPGVGAAFQPEVVLEVRLSRRQTTLRRLEGVNCRNQVGQWQWSPRLLEPRLGGRELEMDEPRSGEQITDAQRCRERDTDIGD